MLRRRPICFSQSLCMKTVKLGIGLQTLQCTLCVIREHKCPLKLLKFLVLGVQAQLVQTPSSTYNSTTWRQQQKSSGLKQTVPLFVAALHSTSQHNTMNIVVLLFIQLERQESCIVGRYRCLYIQDRRWHLVSGVKYWLKALLRVLSARCCS